MIYYKMGHKKDITLDEVTGEEYMNLMGFWAGSRPIEPEFVYSRVSNPLFFQFGRDKAKTYQRAILFLLDHEAAYKISIFNQGVGWCKTYNDYEILEGWTERMARAAILSGNAGLNYFEAHFGEEDEHGNRTKISFTEYRGYLIGNVVNVRFEDRDLFTIKTGRDQYTWNKGVWVPDNYENLTH
ncbi:MAG: hypothetical protein ABIH64_07080 [Nanoarchaeota archaeon]